MFTIIFLVGINFFLQSCRLMQLNNGQLLQGYNSGFQLLSAEEESRVRFLTTTQNIDDTFHHNFIYAIQASHLKKFITNHSKTLVYLWSPHCTSDGCIRIAACQEYTTNIGYQLIVISDYYNMQMMEEQNQAIRPIFIVNHQFYKSNISAKYNKRFWAEFAFDNYPASVYQKYDRFLFFEKDKLVKTKNDLFQ
jgi:hypothetical protein